MSIDAEDMQPVECTACGLLAYDAHICPACAVWDRSLRYGDLCSRKCDDCGEWYCFEHIDEDATICNGCKSIGWSDAEYPFAKNH